MTSLGDTFLIYLSYFYTGTNTYLLALFIITVLSGINASKVGLKAINGPIS